MVSDDIIQLLNDRVNQYNHPRFIEEDPVFSDYASPFSFVNKVFEGTNAFKTKDLPAIDYLIMTHDHWDHLDYKTVSELKPKIKHIICGLGVGQHFEYWGFNICFPPYTFLSF